MLEVSYSFAKKEERQLRIIENGSLDLRKVSRSSTTSQKDI